MKLNLRDLHQFAFGLDHWEIVDDEWRAHRLSRAMEARYLAQDENDRFRTRFLCPSGVRLRFVTTTRKLWLELRYGFEARPAYQGAMFVDGNEEVVFGPQQRQKTWAGIAYEQAERKRRLLDIWLPHLSQAGVLGLTVDDGSSIAPGPGPASPLRWLAYGDSITQGMTATLPTRTVIARCARALNAEVRNVALGSAKMDEWLADTVPAGAYDLVSIAYGTNDYHRCVPVERFQHNARRLVAALKKKRPDCPIVLLTPLTWVRPSAAQPDGPPLARYRESLLPLAAEFKQVRIVPGEQMIPEAEEWFVDGVHPNDRGFEVYAKNLLPHLKEVLGR